MGFCTVDHVRSKINTKLADQDIQNIIDGTSADVYVLCETSSSDTNPYVQLAGEYSILADVLRLMKSTGEAAATIQEEDYRIQNTTDATINFYQEKANFYIEKYTNLRRTVFRSPSFHKGIVSPDYNEFSNTFGPFE